MIAQRRKFIGGAWRATEGGIENRSPADPGNLTGVLAPASYSSPPIKALSSSSPMVTVCPGSG